MAAAEATAESDVRAQTANQPGTRTTGMRSPKLDDIAEEELENGSYRHRREGIRGSADRGPG